MHDVTTKTANASTSFVSFKTVNGKEACTTANIMVNTIRIGVKRFKTVNGKEACTTIYAFLHYSVCSGCSFKTVNGKEACTTWWC